MTAQVVYSQKTCGSKQYKSKKKYFFDSLIKVIGVEDWHEDYHKIDDKYL